MPTDSIYTKILLHKYPVQKGDTWRYPNLIYDLRTRQYEILDTITYTCVDTSVDFETPLGKFTCVVYFHREQVEEDVLVKHDVYEYYSVKVGAVGVITSNYFESNKQTIPSSKRVLVATNVKPNE